MDAINELRLLASEISKSEVGNKTANLSRGAEVKRLAETMEAANARLTEENRVLKDGLTRIAEKAESWQGRNKAPYWNLGDIARATLKRVAALATRQEGAVCICGDFEFDHNPACCNANCLCDHFQKAARHEEEK